MGCACFGASLGINNLPFADTASSLTADGGSEIACGWLKDRWGVFWQVTPTRLIKLIPDSDRERARRAMEEMVKIDIAEVERAAIFAKQK